MRNVDDLNKLRLQLLNNGYTPLPNRDKICFLPGWSKVKVDQDTICTWPHTLNAKATGLRVENGLCVIDIDINHRIIEDVCDAMLDTLPVELNPHRLERKGKGYKLAWFCRTDDLFSRLHTRRWIAPGHSMDDGTHSIEIFGGGSSRQFGAFGPHTIDQNGRTLVVYRWLEESPLDVPLNALDIISKKQLHKMLDAAEKEMKLQGFKPIPFSKKGESTPKKVYDLTECMRFKLHEGDIVSFTVLQNMVSQGYTGRCSASWLEGESAVNTTRCLISKTRTGHVAIWESSSGETHLPAAIKPKDSKKHVDRIAEKLREKSDQSSLQLDTKDDCETTAAKLLKTYAFMPTSRTQVVPLWTDGQNEAMTMANFRMKMRPYCSIEIGPRGGEKCINPADIWLDNPARVDTVGMQMRPDRERPTFEEGGKVWLNTYHPTDFVSADGGNPDGGIKLIEQVFPKEKERAWFLQWLAYKWNNPHVPGPAIISVAQGRFGTGRGTLKDFMKKLFGNRYVVDVPFSAFTGKNYQSQYNSWQFDNLIAFIDESSASGDISTYKMKRDVYEHLKQVVDPASTERLHIRKGETSFYAPSSTSYIIATNHRDAIPLPASDRRFAVLTGGKERDPKFWKFIRGWMTNQSNIAAFSQWLCEINLEGYDPYAVPPKTLAKIDIAESNKTEFDIVIEQALSSIDGFFVSEQIIKIVRDIAFKEQLDLPEKWKSIAKKIINMHYERVRFSDKSRYLETQIDGKTYRAIYFKGDKQPDWTTEQIRSGIIKNGYL